MPESRYPKEVVLKDGREVTIRILCETDADALCGFYRNLDAAVLWYMKENPCDPAVVAKWLQKQKEGNAFSIVADLDGKIGGHGTLLFRRHGGRNHVGRLRIYVASDHRRIQLGTWMIFDLIKYAMERGLEMLRTDFVVGVDDLAIEAVRKLDFVTEGLLRDYVKDENGNDRDYQIMIKRLHRDWSDF